MDKKYKEVGSIEDEELEAITGGTKIRRPQKIFNLSRHIGKYHSRLYEKKNQNKF